MTHTEPDPTAAPGPVEGISIPVLPARDIAETLALFERFGFTVRHDEENDYAMVRRGTVELHFTASPTSIRGTAPGSPSCASTTPRRCMRSSSPPGWCRSWPCRARSCGPPSAFVTSPGAKWDAGESIARMGEMVDQPWRIPEFPLLDCNNNLIPFGEVLGWAGNPCPGPWG